MGTLISLLVGQLPLPAPFDLVIAVIICIYILLSFVGWGPGIHFGR